MIRPAIAILDDYQGVALKAADWSAVEAQAEITTFREPWKNEDEIAAALAPFEIIVLMRERTALPGRLIERLPRLRMVAMTGFRTTTLDVAACRARGVTICHTTAPDSCAATELAFALALACARTLPAGVANMRQGHWQGGLAVGIPLEGRRLGVVGLGKLGSRAARIGHGFGMEVLAWSPNLTVERAAAAGARLVDKAELFASADIVTLHLVLSERTRLVVGEPELKAMKAGAILINTARGPLVDEAALVRELATGRIAAGLDVYDVEPLPAGHPLRLLPNVVLTPHLGFVVGDVYAHYYRDSVENILAYLDGRPIRVLEG